MSSPRAVLHITSAPGGGVDRYIRDIAANVPLAHLALHVGSGTDVIEDLATGRLWPVPAASDAVAQILARQVELLHVHTLDESCRARATALRAHRDIPFIATLHDVSFAYVNAFAAGIPVAREARSTSAAVPWLQDAAAVVVPSAYMRELARENGMPLDPLLIAPGIARPSAPPRRELPASFRDEGRSSVIAVVGAIGPHKGSALLADIARALHKAGSALVVIGYTDTRLMRGWVSPGLFVHGPYTDDELAAWLEAYAPHVAIFPNRLPESFSYTLSEVWATGIPVVVPDEGALGERVRAQGGGWLLPSGFTAQEASRLLLQLLSTGRRTEWARVKSAIVPSPERVPDLADMAQAIGAVYARFGLTRATPQEPADLQSLAHLLAVNINGSLFRQELVHLCATLDNSEVARLTAEREAAAQSARASATSAWAEKLQADLDETRAWIAKVEADVAVLNEELARRDTTIGELQRTTETLRQDNQRLALEEAAFHQLPQLAQRLLRWKLRHGR
ncbi:MAG: glycosyltransferase [Pseudomonadota bacterium]|nr:glycosyltransferase [Pseudomonadota bacterium]